MRVVIVALLAVHLLTAIPDFRDPTYDTLFTHFAWLVAEIGLFLWLQDGSRIARWITAVLLVVGAAGALLQAHDWAFGAAIPYPLAALLPLSIGVGFLSMAAALCFDPAVRAFFRARSTRMMRTPRQGRPRRRPAT